MALSLLCPRGPALQGFLLGDVSWVLGPAHSSTLTCPVPNNWPPLEEEGPSHWSASLHPARSPGSQTPML